MKNAEIMSKVLMFVFIRITGIGKIRVISTSKIKKITAIR